MRGKFFLLSLIAILFYVEGAFILRKNESIEQVKPGVGVGVYVINLDSSRGRLNYVLPKIEQLGLPWKRVSAVDGKSLSEEELKSSFDDKRYRQYMGHMPKYGTIGCSLSHIKVWREFIESDYNYALIIEDDIDFSPDVLLKNIGFIERNNKYWDIVNLETLHRGMPTITLVRGDKNEGELVVYLTQVTHAGAYIINKRAAAKLLERALPVVMPVDHYYTRGWEFGLVFAGLEPRIVFQIYGNSDIEPTRYLEGEVVYMQQIKRIIFRLKSDVARFVYNLYCSLNPLQKS